LKSLFFRLTFVQIYFSCRRSAEIFPNTFVKKSEIKKPVIFAALEGALCRADNFALSGNQPALEFQAFNLSHKP